MDWYEQEFVEPDSGLRINSPNKTEFKIGLNVTEIDKAVSSYIEDFIKNNLSYQIEKEINSQLSANFPDKDFIKDTMRAAINKRLEDNFPEVVENKVNEFAEFLKNLKPSDRNDSWRNKKIIEAAHDQVNDYIENELKDSVAKSKDYIEQFSKNYFANNLFKAMGMMDKMIPTTENTLENKE